MPITDDEMTHLKPDESIPFGGDHHDLDYATDSGCCHLRWIVLPLGGLALQVAG
jgi:hypothetical protein